MIINSNNIEKWCFDYFEGNLSYHERLAFERFILEHPEHHAEFDAWKEAANSEDDNDNIPAYIGMEGLIVGAPFYATMAFRLTVGIFVAITLGTFSYFQLSVPDMEYVARNNSVQMNWSPEDHKLAVVRFTDYAYGDYEVKTNTVTTLVTNYIYEHQEDVYGESSSYNTPNGNLNELNVSNVSSYYSSSDDNDIDALDTDTDDDLLAYHEAKEIVEEDLYSEEVNWTDNYQEDDKTLFEHLEMNHGRYQFLNFNNGKVKGLGRNTSSSNNKKNHTQNNHATISQSKMKGNKGGSGNKKKSHFFDNLKHLELGLTNINDPIAIAPNSNTIGINPALAGQLGVTRLKMNVRNQWWNTEASLFKGSLYFDTYFEKLQAGVAYGTEYDMTEDGKQTINKHSFTYAQKISLSKSSNISVGLTYEMSKGTNSSNEIRSNEFYMNSPVVSNSLAEQWKSNLGVSTWYSGKYFFGGFNVTNLLGNTFIATHEENTSYIKSLNYSVQLGTDYKRSMFASTVLSPYVQYNKMGNYQDLWLGSVVRIKGLVFGGSVATSKSAKALLGIQGNKFRFTVSSDYSKSMLLDQYAFSHEVSLRILLGNKNNNWSRYDN